MKKNQIYVVLSLFLFTLVASSWADMDLNITCGDDNFCSGYCVAVGYSFSCYCEPQTQTCFTQEQTSIDESGGSDQGTSSEVSPTEGRATSTDQDTGLTCSTDEECGIFEGGYCDPSYLTCFIATTSAAPVEETVSTEQTAVSDLQGRVDSLESQASTLQQRLNELEGKVNEIKGTVETLNLQQTQAQQDLQQKVEAVSTGLAGLQDNLQAVKQDVAQRPELGTILLYLFLILLVLAVALGTIYFLIRTAKNKPSEINPEIVDYIIKHIKQGLNFFQIKEKLLRVGWLEEDIIRAYQETTRRLYPQAKKGAASKFSPEQKKFLVIGAVSVLLIVSVFLLLQGISTGKAIAFGTQGELDSAVEQVLEKNLVDNLLVSLVPAVNLCVQVVDGKNSVSYNVIKTSLGQAIIKASVSCDSSRTADFAVKFLNWESFNFLANDLTCEKATKINQPRRMVIILPSQYILRGFKLNPAKDASKYCALLTSCLTPEQLALTGVKC